jgi:hypothetical protein
MTIATMPQLSALVRSAHQHPQIIALQSYAEQLERRSAVPIERMIFVPVGMREHDACFIADRIDGSWQWQLYRIAWDVPATHQKHESVEGESIYSAIKNHRKPLDKGDALLFWQGTAAPTKHPKAQWRK